MAIENSMYTKGWIIKLASSSPKHKNELATLFLSKIINMQIYHTCYYSHNFISFSFIFIYKWPFICIGRSISYKCNKSYNTNDIFYIYININIFTYSSSTNKKYTRYDIAVPTFHLACYQKL